jgi:replicative DNA helicase
LQRKALDPGADGAEVLREAERAVFALAEVGAAGQVVWLADAVEDTVNYINDRATDGGVGMAGLPTGLPPLDDLTGGLPAGELVVVAARPSIGKTSVALTFAGHSAREGRTVLFTSLEMSRRALATRMLCSESGVDGQLVRTGRLGNEDVERLSEVRTRLLHLPLAVDDCPEQSVLRIAANARRLKRQGKLDLVVVDYLQLVAPGGRQEPRHEQVAEISRRLKALAKELEVPVLALSQLNRECESRPDGRPKLADLRESGQIEADADQVLLLHRPKGHEDQLEVIVAKNRNGPTGEVGVKFDRSLMRFDDLAFPARFAGN